MVHVPSVRVYRHRQAGNLKVSPTSVSVTVDQRTGVGARDAYATKKKRDLKSCWGFKEIKYDILTSQIGQIFVGQRDQTRVFRFKFYLANFSGILHFCFFLHISLVQYLTGVEKYCYLLARIYVIGIRYVCLADKISTCQNF